MCVLCQGADRPITREHIFARWLIRQVHGAKLVPSQGALSTAAPLRIARVVVPVCADCNAGWMSGVEVSFRRRFFAGPPTGRLRASQHPTLRWRIHPATHLHRRQHAPETNTRWITTQETDVETHRSQ